jgi:LPPG:FO 2-phospho-L-lactate transferase
VTTLAVLCGGVGAARFLRGVVSAGLAPDTTAIVNTADDAVLHGLYVSPDLDTCAYTLSGAIDPERGWGLAGESWAFMGALARFENVGRHNGYAVPTWFNLGDRDLATHAYRTARLAQGATLTQVTAEITEAFDVPVRLLPMTDGHVATKLTISDGESIEREVDFQEYFVGRRHSVPVTAVRFDGVEGAQATDAVISSLRNADRVVIAPSNPIVSIGPLLALPGLADAIDRNRTVAVSPIVAGSALKGPADRLLGELGHEASVVGVARLYAPHARWLVIDDADADLADDVRASGLEPIVTSTVMSTPEIAAALAHTCAGAPA